MRIISRRAAMAALSERWRGAGLSIGFVPTMGALHAGHASLISRARKRNKRVVVSVFVNPMQFGPKEDFGRYPRTLDADRRLCAGLGADALYHPSPEEMYPEGFSTAVEVGGLSSLLCGAFRPGHFRGVATVVLKLFETVRPVRAYFGEKDFQQLVIIKRMTEDLGLDVSVVGCPIVREKDGLALSSRNRYLKPAERARAGLLYAALRWASRARTLSLSRLEKGVRARIQGIPGVSIDYISGVDPATLGKPRREHGAPRLLAAIRLASSKTRLIDNIALKR